MTRRFGWLPGGQAIVFVASTAGFALLARVLGPEPYAKYAVILFVFTLSSLVTDLSPQSYAIVSGLRLGAEKVAFRLALVSSVAGAFLLAGAIHVANHLILQSQITPSETLLLELAFLVQMLTQVQRAKLVLDSRFRTMALIDILATIVALTAAIYVAARFDSALALTLQLALVATVRGLAVTLAALKQPRAARPQVGAFPTPTMRSSLKFGVKLIPLNLASYLSRSIDSGLLPGVLPAAAAAGYSRSYQVVVVPIQQLQLALGPAILSQLARGNERTGALDRQMSRRLWNLLQAVAGTSAVAIIAASSVIQAVIFGDGWPVVNVMIAAMACLLPALATATYCAWVLQVQSRISQTAVHLAVMISMPIAIVVAATASGTQGALIALLLGAGLQPIALIIVHRQVMPDRVGPLVLRFVATWAVLATGFLVVATNSDFWSYQA